MSLVLDNKKKIGKDKQNKLIWSKTIKIVGSLLAVQFFIEKFWE